jgi:hypothetical protein
VNSRRWSRDDRRYSPQTRSGSVDGHGKSARAVRIAATHRTSALEPNSMRS